jgi:hypothetical protein
MTLTTARTRRLTVVAQDPGVRSESGRILCVPIELPAEALDPGPWGHRIQVVDFDATTNRLLAPLAHGAYAPDRSGNVTDPFENVSNRTILSDPQFHAQNVYAIVTQTLARFERALGRRVNWGFFGHQLRIAPHAFADANAFYAPEERALFFGYFAGETGRTIFTCLSHDIIAHETTHAVLDGIRTRFTDPSSPDQAAFHEGFADCVALLSVFSQREVVEQALELSARGANLPTTRARRVSNRLIARSALTREALAQSVLLGLAEQMGKELASVRGSALRRSVLLTPSKTILDSAAYAEPHRRGEVLVAAVMQTFMEVWATRLDSLRRFGAFLNLNRVAEEGSAAADYLLTMLIRALDYTPPVHLEFRDFVSAVLTADMEVREEDGPYAYRAALLARFKAFGIEPAAPGSLQEPGTWSRSKAADFSYDRSHFEAMQHDPDEVFGFVWENREALRFHKEAYTRVLSVRPCIRVGPDGFVLKETVTEVLQRLDVTAGELATLGIKKPREMTPATPVALLGGSTLIFDEYGRLKYEIHNDIMDTKRQSARIKCLFENGYFDGDAAAFRPFAEMHRRRTVTAAVPHQGW